MMNMYLNEGLLLISVYNPSKESKILDKIGSELKLNKANEKDQVILYTCKIVSKLELDKIIIKICSSGIKPNIYTK